MASRAEVTSKRAATAASKVLRSGDSSKTSKSAAGSALSQRKAPEKVTSGRAASAASTALRSAGSSKSSKTSAGSALTQRPSGKK